MQDEDSKDPQSMKDVEDQKAAKKKSAQRKVSKNTTAKTIISRPLLLRMT